MPLSGKERYKRWHDKVTTSGGKRVTVLLGKNAAERLKSLAGQLGETQTSIINKVIMEYEVSANELSRPVTTNNNEVKKLDGRISANGVGAHTLTIEKAHELIRNLHCKGNKSFQEIVTILNEKSIRVEVPFNEKIVKNLFNRNSQ